jgi:16S rRNA processing protein RimM
VKPHNPLSPALSECREIWLQPRGSEPDEPPTRFEVTASRPHRGMFLVGLGGVTTLDALEPWIGSTVSISKSSIPEAGEGELYDWEAIGLEVRTLDDALVGRVVEVMSNAGSGVWVVHAPSESGRGKPREILIPVAGEIVKEIDLQSKVARIDPPRGLLEE